MTDAVRPKGPPLAAAPLPPPPAAAQSPVPAPDPDVPPDLSVKSLPSGSAMSSLPWVDLPPEPDETRVVAHLEDRLDERGNVVGQRYATQIPLDAEGSLITGTFTETDQAGRVTARGATFGFHF